jgi:3-phenylpropionate/trans-cinnamate dioxygenase ferredoxin reductase subunit
LQTCLIIGAGIASAQVATSMRQASFKGPINLVGEKLIAPYERPPVSKSFLTSNDEIQPVFFVLQRVTTRKTK